MSGSFVVTSGELLSSLARLIVWFRCRLQHDDRPDIPTPHSHEQALETVLSEEL